MSPLLVIAAVVLSATSGLAAVLLRRRPEAAQRLATGMLVLGALAGMAGAALALAAAEPPSLRIPWGVPGGSLSLRLDGLSAIFLFPILGVPALGSIYGLGYWQQARLGARAIRLQVFYGLAAGSMALVCTAANAILFLVAWEVMALAAFLLVLTEHEKPEAQRSAFVYLASAHVGNLGLFAAFVLLAHAAGSWEFSAMAGLDGRGGVAAAIFALALLGFGLKAGLMPLHFWLPGAHAAAPSHVSAILSGVLLKTGLYGLLRVTGFFRDLPLAWGTVVFAIGVVSGVLGVAFALAQHDLKRLLAYHSVENVGIIAMGIGLALMGRARGDPTLVLLGFAGGVLHVVNHATFKGLLFLGAGAVVHSTGTRDIDHLGGLARAMPWTAALFAVGAAAISGLPPLNGIASEWLVALASVHSALEGGSPPHPHFAALGAPALALIGGLAAACFAKVVGAVFLGQGRSPHAARGHEPGPAMLGPMVALALACAAIGLAPAALLPALSGAAAQWSGMGAAALAGPAADAGASGLRISLAAAALLLLAAALWLWRRRRLPAPQPAAETWGCGFARPSPRMQYTGSSFAEALVLRFGWAFFPRARVVPPRGFFPGRAAFHSSVPDTVLDVAISPAFDSATRLAERARRLTGGLVQFQAFLLVIALVGLLAWLFLSVG
jgi:formate hydrogenlyase subunit 3/multisubunit Na+/H+ antiporter MnhD subunit